MDSNFIKDNRVFPEEMSTSKKTTNTSDHPTHVVGWIVGLLVLLGIVFFIGLWAGKKTAQVVRDQGNEAAQRERQAALVEQEKYTDVYVTPEDRADRLRVYFSE